jgi:hypothetical protein
VSDQVAVMDAFALKNAGSIKNAGSSIAASIVGTIAAVRDAAKETQNRKDEKQKIEKSETDRDKWRKKLDEATDIDQYIQDNPPPAWFVEGVKDPLPYADEYIDDARKSLARRNAPQSDPELELAI